METNGSPRRALAPLAWSGLAYAAIGIGTALVTNPIAEPGLQAILRIVSLVLGALVFALHCRREFRAAGPSRGAAVRAAGGAALGGLLLAVWMVAYNVAVRSRTFGSVALVLVVWPVFTGGFGFVLALLAGWIVAARRRRGSARPQARITGEG